MSAQALVKKSEPHGHIVQLYEADSPALYQNVGRYLWEGLNRGEGVLVIATQEHTEAFAAELEHLGIDPLAAVQEKRLRFLDAEETMDRFMMNGKPNWKRFERTIGTALSEVRTADGGSRNRAYGEMVGLLWERGQQAAAIELEGLWNALRQTNGLQLFCGYPIDVFSKDFHSGAVDGVLAVHTHVVATDSNGDLKSAVNRAMDEVLGPAAENIRSLMNAKPQRAPWAAVPAGEAAILWLRNHLPQKADEVAARARDHYHSEKRFRALVENSCDAISLMDDRGTVTYASPSTQRILGYESHELIGRKYVDLFHPEDAGAVRAMLQSALANPRHPQRWQGRMLRRDQRWCWAEGTTNNLSDDPDVRALVSNFRDITDRKAAEQEKAQRTAELARSNAELQAFAYAAAHDLTEPLRTVCSYAQLLQRSASETERQEFAGIIVDSVTRMGALLDGLLVFARMDFDESPGPVELRHSVEKAIQNLEQAVKESGARILFDPLPVVQGSESHLIELFQNLIGNAIKYRSEAPVEVRISSEPFEREWLIKVRDNGVGIPPEYHDQIFGLFKRLHGRDIPGTGIGLAICKKIVEGLGGQIWVESEPGRGSTFCFTIGRVAPGGPDCKAPRVQ